MIWREVKIAGASNPGRYSKISAESSTNVIVNDGALVGFPGYKFQKAVNVDQSQRTNGLEVSTLGNFMIAASGTNIYTINSDLDIENIGSVKNNPEGVSFAENGNSQIGISDGTSYYVYNYGSNPSYTKVNDNNYVDATSAMGYIFLAHTNSNTFIYSNVNDATTTFPIDNTGEIGSDEIVAIETLNDKVWVIGKRTSKVWTNLGSAVNPWRLDPTSPAEYGCVNKNTVASAYGIIAWLSVSTDGLPTVVASTGGFPEEISTPGLDAKLEKLSSPEDSLGFMFQSGGQTYYCLTFVADNLTIVYDFRQKLFYYATDENGDRFIAYNVKAFAKKYYFMSLIDANLYELGSDITVYQYKDKTELIPRIRITPPYRTPAYDYYRIAALTIAMREGMTDDQAYIDLSWSNDGGVSFGNNRRLAMSPPGQRQGFIQTNLLGAARDWTFKYEFWTNGPIAAIESSVQVNNADFSATA